MQAAILIEKLKIFDDEIDAPRTGSAARYAQALGNVVTVSTSRQRLYLPGLLGAIQPIRLPEGR